VEDEQRTLGKTTSQFRSFITTQGFFMNKHQVNGAAKGALGRAQERAGKAVGSSGQEAKGLVRQAEAKLQKAYGDLKEALKNSRHQ
jgi:uncharacterized protein YjbJ (UPF0337 family)